jgi:hypothetical protein
MSKNNKCMNVMLSKCFWCGADKNELLIGKELIDCNNNASRAAIANYEPCDKCKEQWDKGFVFIEVQDEPVTEGQPAMQKGAYPTSNLWIITKESANEVLNKEIVDGGMCFIEKEFAEKIGLYGEDNEQS